MEHVIITRHGLGQAMPGYYAKKTRYFEEVVAPAMARQSSKDFVWLVLTDAMAPKQIRKRVDKAVKAVPGAEVVVHDPLEGGKLLPDLDALVRSRRTRKGPVLITRLDDDDAIHPDFCQNVQKLADHMVTADRVKLPSVITYSHGVFLSPDTIECLEVEFPGVSVNSTISSGKSIYHPYRHSHVELEQAVQRRGGTARIVATDEPMWLRTIRRDSEATRGKRDVADYFQRLVSTGSWMIESARYIDWDAAAGALKLAADFPVRLQRIEEEFGDEHVPLTRPTGSNMKRMGIKNTLLEIAQGIRADNGVEEARREKYLATLAEAFYRF
jgi:hypothetical protein